MTTETTTTATPETPGADAPGADAPGLLGTDTPAGETKPVEGETKPVEGETKPAEAAEVKYEFKAPDGIELDAPHLEKFTNLAKEMKLSPENAQKFVDIASEMQMQQIQQHTETVKGWLEAVKGDKELGGDKLPENLAVAKKTFDLLPEAQSKELKALLNQTGLEAHPVFFRLFHAVGEALSEDKFITGGKKPQGQTKSTAERLYPSSTAA